MGTLAQDIRYGLRMMARTPIVSVVATLSLALGIAANASTFSLLNSFLFEPLPYEEQENILILRDRRIGEDIQMAAGVSVPNYRDYVEGVTGLASSAVYTIETVNLTGLDVPEQLSVVVTSPSLFDVLGVRPVLGRGFRPDEGVEGAGAVLVLTHDFWERRFLADPDILDRVVMVGGTAYTVIGVMPEGFDLIPANVQAFRPSDFRAVEDRSARGYLALARLTSGGTVASVQGQVDAVVDRLAAEFPDTNRGREVVAQPIRQFFPGPTDRTLILILTAVTLFGLLIACANVANLLLGRAEDRQREIAVRTALGAGRGRLIRQLLTESVLMAVVAGGIGSMLAYRVVGWMRDQMPPMMPRAVFPSLEPEVLVVTLAVSVLAGVLFGLAPALHAVSGNLRDGLAHGARGGRGGRRRRLVRNSFVVGEIAAAVALLTAAGVLIQAFRTLAYADSGIETDGMLTFQVSIGEDRYATDQEVVTYTSDLEAALRRVPGVEGVAIMTALPRSQITPSARYWVEGRPVPDPVDRLVSGIHRVNVAYFETLGIEPTRGQLFSPVDQEDSDAVAVVSEAFVEREFAGDDPLGRSLNVLGRPRRIIGVVETVLQDRMRLAGTRGEHIYLPAAQVPLRDPYFTVLAPDTDPAALAVKLREAVWSVQADQPVAEMRTLDAHIAESLAGPRSIGLFLAVIGLVSLGLAAMGVYGVMSHSVTQQSREIGIRMALGAARSQVVGLVAGAGLRLIVLGAIIGTPLAFLLVRSAGNGMGLFETDVGFFYPAVLLGLLMFVATVATVLPADRASRIPPVVVLRD